MNKQTILSCCVMAFAGTSVMAQMENSIKLNEIVTQNKGGLQDEYGQREAWVEIANISHSTYNIRGMFVTTDRSVLDKSLSAPERMKRMSIVPNGDDRTNLTARQHIIFYLNSNPAKGTLHLTVPVEPGKPTWVALYNGNGVNLIDSVTVPALQANHSYARTVDGGKTWETKKPETVTPWINNDMEQGESKIAKVKRTDPHGFGIAVLSMGIVFFCLALLYTFFSIFGMFMRHRETARKMASIQPLKAGVKTVEKTMDTAHKANVILQDGLKSKGIDREVYMAVIVMALKQYQDDVHDMESGVITIKPKHTEWNVEFLQMTQFHE